MRPTLVALACLCFFAVARAQDLAVTTADGTQASLSVAGPGEGGLFDTKTGDVSLFFLDGTGNAQVWNQGSDAARYALNAHVAICQKTSIPTWWGICHGVAPGVIEIVLLPGPVSPEALRDLFEEAMLSGERFFAIPRDALRVQLVWNKDQTDVDLHSIRETTTGTDTEYRVYGPGKAHFGSASSGRD